MFKDKNKMQLKFDEVTRTILIVVCIASVILGVSAVGGIYLAKRIAFSARLIGDKTAIINDYGKSYDSLNRLNGEINELASNPGLEASARDVQQECKLSDGSIIDFEAELERASAERRPVIEELMRQCSALRVIPDALPAVYNDVALMASLNKIFLESGVEPESLSPADSGQAAVGTTGVGAIGVNLRVEDEAVKALGLLNNIEISIRAFDVQRITIEWKGGSQISLRGTANAFYMNSRTVETRTLTIKPNVTTQGIGR
jgi:hypothetical protein